MSVRRGLEVHVHLFPSDAGHVIRGAYNSELQWFRLWSVSGVLMDAEEIKQLRKAVLEVTKCVINLQGAVILLARDHRGDPTYPLICDELEAAGKAISEALKALE